MAGESAIVVVDENSELDDFRVVLEELGLDFASWSKEALPPAGVDPHQLLIATAPAAAVLGGRTTNIGGHRAVWIGVCASEGRAQRNLLLSRGFDYLVHRPVHPSAVRSLLRHALYKGSDQRRAPRVAVGYEVTYKTGLFSKPAVLVDLSLGACRVFVSADIPKDTKLKVCLPHALTGGKALPLIGRVLRSRAAELEGGQPGQISVGIRFAPMSTAERARLQTVIGTLEAGPARMPDVAMPPGRTDGTVDRAPRCVYEDEVQVFGDSEFLLMGRNLSRTGMNVALRDGLNVGESLNLAITTGPREEPIVVRSTVVRSDSGEGLGLRFDTIQSTDQRRLDAIISEQPQIEEVTSPGESERMIPLRLLPSRLMTSRGRR